MSQIEIIEPVHGEDVPTMDHLLDLARDLVPVLKERALRCEDNRRLLEETVADFQAAGFYRITQPRKYHGYEMDPQVAYRVSAELAHGCGSSAWCLGLIAIHNWEIALMDPQAAEDVWGEDDTARISSSYAPFGKVERIDGGFQISGRWSWSSGCNHCQWVLVGGLVTNTEGDRPEHRAFLIPRKEYEIDDTWHVMGLKGTGSNDIVVDNVFVPEHRTHSLTESFYMRDPGREHFTSPIYKYPFFSTFVSTLSWVTVGIAKGALTEFLEQNLEKLSTYDRSRLATDPFVQQRVAEAQAIISSAENTLDRNFAYMSRCIDSSTDVPIDFRIQVKWDAQFATKQCMEAVTLLLKASGARGLKLSNPMQRFFRDIHAASNHAFLNASKGSANAGATILGGEVKDFSV